MKKFLSYLIATIMLFGMIPSTAFASEVSSEINTGTYEWINPQYENRVEPSFNENEEYDISAFSDDVVYHTSYESAGEAAPAPTQASAEPDFTFSYDSTSKTLTFYGTGAINFEESADGWSKKNWAKYSEITEHLVIEDGITGVGNFAFMSFRKLETIDFPDKMEWIGQQAFWACSSLKEVTLPDGMSSYGSGFFEDCISLESVTFGSTPDNISVSHNPFRSCNKLKTINVPDSNSIFSVKDGVLFAGDTLLCYPATLEETEYVIPEGTRTIGSFAFSYCDFLETVIMPDSLEAICYSFYGCDGLKTLTIPESVTHFVQSEIFAFCHNLRTIVNNSNVELQIPNNYYHPEGKAYWVNRETGMYTNTLLKGTVDKVILGDLKLKRGTFKVDGVTYQLLEDAEHITEAEMNEQKSVAKVKVIKLDSEYSIVDKVCYKGWYYDVEPVEHTPKTTVVKATTKNAGSITETCTLCKEQLSKTTIAKISKVTIPYAAYMYHGKVRKPVVTVKDADGNKLVKGTDYTVTYKNAKGTKVVAPKAIGEYQVVVKFKGNYDGKVIKTFKINPKGTTIAKVTKPAKKQIKVTWKKQNVQTTGYQIRYATKQNMKNAKMVTVSKANTTTKTIKQLKAKKKYWVQIRTYKTVNGQKYFSGWSAKKTITTR